MLAADTNVVVRLLVSDDLVQQSAALERLERARDQGEAVVITPVVLAEVAWVLDAVYGYARDDIAQAVRSVVSTARRPLAPPPGVCEAVSPRGVLPDPRRSVRSFAAVKTALPFDVRCSEVVAASGRSAQHVPSFRLEILVDGRVRGRRRTDRLWRRGRGFEG
jgi:predicted nucleic acid-binding protein